MKEKKRGKEEGKGEKEEDRSLSSDDAGVRIHSACSYRWKPHGRP